MAEVYSPGFAIQTKRPNASLPNPNVPASGPIASCIANIMIFSYKQIFYGKNDSRALLHGNRHDVGAGSGVPGGRQRIQVKHRFSKITGV